MTDAVLADLADGRSTADFLLSFSIEENGDDEIDRVVLDESLSAGLSLGPRTRLVLTYE